MLSRQGISFLKKNKNTVHFIFGPSFTGKKINGAEPNMAWEVLESSYFHGATGWKAEHVPGFEPLLPSVYPVM